MEVMLVEPLVNVKRFSRILLVQKFLDLTSMNDYRHEEWDDNGRTCWD